MYFSLLLGAVRPSKPLACTWKAHNQGSDENVYSLENLFKESRPSATLTGNIVEYKVSYWVALLPFLPSFNFITSRVPWALLTVAGLSAKSVSVVKPFVDTATTFVNVRQVTSECSVCNHLLLATTLQFFPYIGRNLLKSSFRCSSKFPRMLMSYTANITVSTTFMGRRVSLTVDNTEASGEGFCRLKALSPTAS